MRDALEHLWPHFDEDYPLFSETTIQTWPDDVRGRLSAIGLLRRAESATRTACPACPDGHVEDVMSVVDSDGSRRLYVPCHVNLRVAVAEESLRQWSIGFDRVAALLACALATNGRIEMLVPGRLWRLGKVNWRSGKRVALFARGLQRPGDDTVRERISCLGRVFVFVGNEVPSSDTWTKRVPAVVPLSQVATLGEDGIEVDAPALVSLITEADELARVAEAATLTRGQLKHLVKREVKAQQKKQLTHEGLVAVYRAQGSSRKAEAALRSEGYDVDHTTIARAVKDAREAGELIESESSNSVRRSVASQRRNRKKKM